MRREPDFIIRVWIDHEGIDGMVNFKHTGYGFDHRFNRTYDKPGQLAAIWESFRQFVLEFIEDFGKKR